MYKILAKTLILGKRVVYLPSCHSTNAYAGTLTKTEDWFEGTIVITDSQSHGKGQMGNAWESEPDKNLTFSVLLKPNFVPLARQFQLSMAVALGLVDALNTIVDGFEIKWPNDIYFGTKKVAGILIQNSINKASLEHSIVGVGLNTNQISFNTVNATSLAIIKQESFDLNDLFEKLCGALEKRYLQLKQGRTAELRSQYFQKLLGYNKIRLYSDGEIFEGQIIDVLDSGHLVVQRDKMIKEYDIKQIEFIF